MIEILANAAMEHNLSRPAKPFQQVLESLRLVLGNVSLGNTLSIGAASVAEALALSIDGRRVNLVESCRDKCNRAEAYLRNVESVVPTADKVTVSCVDFNTLSDTYDVVWDYHLLRSTNTDDLPKWAKLMNSLLAQQGELVFLVDQAVYWTVGRHLEGHGLVEILHSKAKTFDDKHHNIVVWRRKQDLSHSSI